MATTLTRKFKIGPVLLDDPAPSLPPEDALRLYASSYPFVTSASLGDPVVEGGSLVYTVSKQAATTKG
jgi:PRTRC genetic system protein C